MKNIDKAAEHLGAGALKMIKLILQKHDAAVIEASMEAIAAERTNTIAQIITLLELQHESAKHQHNQWLVAANLIRAEFWDKKQAHGIKGNA